jgi:ABC-2 type transport system permease protein
VKLVRDTSLIFQRQMLLLLRNPIWILVGIFQPVMYLLLFAPLLKPALGVRTNAEAYEIFVPGLLVLLAIFGGLFQGFGLIAELRAGVIERSRVTPVSRLALLLGRVLRDAAQLLVQSLILVLCGVAFGLRAPVLGVAIGFLFVATLGISLASLSYAFAMRVNTIQEFAPIINSFSLPAMLLSGILLPMALAPAWLDVISHFVPFRYIVDAVRAGFVGDYGSGDVALGALVTAALAAGTLTLGTQLFRRAGA